MPGVASAIALSVALVGACLLWFYLPGWCWSPWLLQTRYPSRSIRVPRSFVELSGSMAITTVVGLCLLEAGVFSLFTMGGALLFVCAAGYWASRRWVRPLYDRSDVAFLSIGVVALFWFSPPFPARLGSGDATGYLGAGILAARTGSLVVHDPSIAHLTVDLRRFLFPSVAADRGSPPYLRLDGGFVLRSLDEPEVLPAFHHGIVPWVASAALVLGEDKMEWVFSAFGALSSLALCAAAYSLGLPLLLAALASALNAIQVPFLFYGRFPMPEVPAAFYVWAGVALAAGHTGRTRVAALAGWVLGCASLLRLENVFFSSAALVVLALFYWNQKQTWALALPAIALNLYALLHAAVWRTHYWGNLAAFLATHRFFISVAIALLAAMFLASGFARWGLRRSASNGLVRIFAVTGVCVLIVVSLRQPHFGQWEILARYCGAAYLPLGFAALAYVSAIDPRPGILLSVSLTGFAAAVFLLAPNAAPVDLWVLRRATSQLLPGIALLLTIALLHVSRAAPAWVRSWLVALGLLVVASGSGLKATAFLAQPYYASARVHEAMLTESVASSCIAVIHGRLAALGFPPLLWAKRDCIVYYIGSTHDWYFAALVEVLRTLGRQLYLFLPNSPGETAPQLPDGHWAPYLGYSFPLASPFFSPGGDLLWRQEEISVYAWRDHRPR